MQGRVHCQWSLVFYPGMRSTCVMIQRLTNWALMIHCLMKVPCKQDVFSIISIQPGRKDWEGLAALAEGRLEAEAA